MKRRSLLTLSVALVLFALYAVPVEAQSEVTTHYWLGRPIPASAKITVDRGMPYGWTRWGQSPIHHGVDLVNRRGTPVIAAADGVIYFAGSDGDRQFGPYPNFYGNTVVIQHDMGAPEGGGVFTLYGHLESIHVQAG